MAACSASYGKKTCNMASESASNSSMKGKMAAESASYGKLKGRTEAESATCSKLLQNARKINGFSCQRKSGQGALKVLPRCFQGAARRNARSPHTSLRGSRYGFRLLQTEFGLGDLTRLSPARGWPYSKRYAHSAGPDPKYVFSQKHAFLVGFSTYEYRHCLSWLIPHRMV